MNEEHLHHLETNYAILFPQGVDHLLVSCGDGWFNIIDRLCGQITDYLSLHFNAPHVQVMQVKEKFATLRFYIEGGDDKIYEMIADAEEESSHTCELTGTPGTLHRRGHWVRTLSEESANKLGYESLKGKEENVPWISVWTISQK